MLFVTAFNGLMIEFEVNRLINLDRHIPYTFSGVLSGS